MADIKNIGHIAENVISLGAQFQSIMDMAQALKGMTSVENAIKERENALAKASADSDAAEAKLKLTQDQTKALLATQTKAMDDHQKAMADEAARITGDANDKATALLAQAQADATSWKVNATEEAAKIKTASDVALAAAQTRLKSVTKAAVDLEEKVAGMQTDHDILAKRMADLKSAAQKIAS